VLLYNDDDPPTGTHNSIPTAILGKIAPLAHWRRCFVVTRALKLKFFSILVGNVFTEKFSFFLYNGCTSKPRCGRQGELQSWMRHDLQQWEAERERERQSLDRFA
jgi:hypothetical protein